MNITGHWKGKYTYGKKYPKAVIGKSESFEIDLVEQDGRVTGACIDEIVKTIKDNESTIEGSFRDNFIIFLKKYKFHLGIDEQGNNVMAENISSDGVQYVGHLKKRFFSKKLFFAGEWQIVVEYRDRFGRTHSEVCDGTWTMYKI